jgi:N-acetylmuramidase
VLSENDYVGAATTLGVDVAAIKAVARVESSGSGFGSDGRPVIRFELHRFQSKTQGQFHKSHPHVSQPSLKAGNPYHNGTQGREYSLLFSAMLLNTKGESMADAAIESASWGKFQIMGENWSSMGYTSATSFAREMFASEAN